MPKGDCELWCFGRGHFGFPRRKGHVKAPDPQKWIWIWGWSRFSFEQNWRFIVFPLQAPDGSDAVLTVRNGRLAGALNYNKPNKLFLIESCGKGDGVTIKSIQLINQKFCYLGCNVLKQADDVGNDGKVEGLESPILDWKYLDDPSWKNFIPKQKG